MPVADPLNPFDYPAYSAPSVVLARDGSLVLVREKHSAGVALGKPVEQAVYPLSRHCDRGDHRDAKKPLQLVDIYVYPLVSGLVDHVQRDHHWQAALHCLKGEEEIALKGGRIEY